MIVPRLEYTQHRDHVIASARKVYRHRRFGADPQGNKRGGHPVGGLVEFPVGVLAAGPGQRDRAEPGCGDLGEPRVHSAARSGRARVDALRQIGRRATLEDLGDTDVHPEPGTQRGNQFRGKQRVPTEVGEGVVGAHPVVAQKLREKIGNPSLGAGGGFAVADVGAGRG